MNRFFWYTITIFLVMQLSAVAAQQEPNTKLSDYIIIGLENNLALKQKRTDWLDATARLKEARGLFYPDISFNARYSVADGGRVIDFPVGDLLNPVYSTLNMLTSSEQFPEIDNEEVPFLRPTEHETKLRLVQPILNTDIIYNSRINQNNTDIIYADMNTYKRQLVFEIKQAYYNYQKAVNLSELLESTMSVLEENLRVNQKLFENNKVTRDFVLRSESEIMKMEEEIASAEGSVEVSMAYFNFLLNRDLNASIEIEEEKLPLVPLEVESYIQSALNKREELEKLENYSLLAENNLKLNRSSRLPEVVAVVDYGFQGEEYSFTAKDDYFMASLVLKWDLFKGSQERSKISQARILEERVDYQIDEAKNMIRLEIINSWYELITAEKKLTASKANSASASEVFRIVSKKYNQDQANLLEFLDARNNMTLANQNMIINKYDLLIKYAEFEKTAGLFEFKTN